MQTLRRVVITGVGLVTPLGANAEASWDNLLRGVSGIKPVQNFDVTDLPAKIAGTISQNEDDQDSFRPDDWLEPKEQRKIDRFILLGLVAATQAVNDSGWAPNSEEEQNKTGVIIGSGIGGLQQIYDNSIKLREAGPRRISPFFIPAALINLVSGHVSIKFGFKGPNHSVVTACSTGAHAIGDAARLVMLGDADVMVAGGAEAAINRLGFAGFAAARALSTNFNETPTEASRPWDKDRDGFVMGEGAGIVVVEELEHAKRRGAQIYGELVGYGLSGDAHHITAPAENGDGAYRAMKNALERSNLACANIDYINAHGTSTPLGDMIELNAVRKLFGRDISGVSMSSTKSSIGHLLGAAGSVEAIFSLLAMRDNIVPPTLNLSNPSEGCQGINLVPHTAQEKKTDAVLSNSFGFGGTNASLVFKKL